jgi:DNA-binding MarR family transcriptional regulator
MGRAGRFSEQEYVETASFRVALHAFLRLADDHARNEGLTSQQYALLLTLRGNQHYPRVILGELADALKVRQASASLLVDRCVRDGYIRRHTDPTDQRRRLLSLTAQGQRLLDRVMEANRQDLGRLDFALLGTSLRDALQEPMHEAS